MFFNNTSSLHFKLFVSKIIPKIIITVEKSSKNKKHLRLS
ncbi:hypothetical protein T190607A02C_110031 [Tenacibaculum sp. 190524A02b]